MSATTPEIRQEENGGRGAFFVEGANGRLAEMTYRRTPEGKRVIIDHTFVDGSLRGGGVGRRLVDTGVAWARREGLRILPLCPYARSVLERGDEYRDVLWKDGA